MWVQACLRVCGGARCVATSVCAFVSFLHFKRLKSFALTLRSQSSVCVWLNHGTEVWEKMLDLGDEEDLGGLA